MNSLLKLALLACLSACSNTPHAQVAHTVDQFNDMVRELQAGDEVVLADGIWRDVELAFTGNGTPEQPITLRAQTPGLAIISGQSNLSISGSHLIVRDLVFKDGYTPTSEVIAYRTSKLEVANHVRVTNIVIDGFTNPERFSADTWVAMYGKNNRFDHNTLTNKGNQGVTLAVKMKGKLNQENGHVVEYNYFGPRQTLGSNGGETLRIGTSHFSRENSNTIVRKNYFDRTSGELEIVSSKSCGNIIEGNVFYESQGTLTMRHGHFTTVQNNYFLGNRKPNTGGIRIINENQTVQNNYLYGLTGHRFRGAMVIMNRVDSRMDNNIVVDSDHIQLCAGSDEERSAVPTGSTMQNNIFMSRTNPNLFTIYDDISGISFAGNIANEEVRPPVKRGFKPSSYSVSENTHGLRAPDEALTKAIGFDEVKLPVTKEETGADFYSKSDQRVEFASGKSIEVPPGTNTLLEALAESNGGDTLILSNGGEYLLTKLALVHHPITIKSKFGEKPVIRSEKSNFFVIENGGSLELENLWIDGAESPDLAGNSAISTSRYSMNQNYSLLVKNCKVTDLDVNHSFHFLKVAMSTFADRIEVSNTEMSNITGSILALNKETDDLGIYNAENITLIGNTFSDIQGPVADVYRGGTDESTFGPIVTIEDNKFLRIGTGKRNKSKASLKFYGVQKLNISNSRWEASAPLELFLTNGEPITEIVNVVMKDTEKLVSNSDQYTAENVSYE